MRTEKGDIRTPWVVNAPGLWVREVATMAGVTLPLMPTEHQYFVTETIPEIAAMASSTWPGGAGPADRHL